MIPSTVDQLIELRRAIVRSRTAIAEGAIIELAGLDNEVARITSIARQTPPSERTEVLTAMSELVQEIDGLAKDLRRQRDAALALQAAHAYRTEQADG
jgi:hypothetical protein